MQSQEIRIEFVYRIVFCSFLQIESLHLIKVGSELGDDGCVGVSEYLETNKTLTYLNLSMNFFFFKRNNQLTHPFS